MTEEEKKKIIDRLVAASATQDCPRCKNGQFVLVDGYVPLPLHETMLTMGNIVAGGPVVPCVMVACQRCGWLSFHATGILLKEPEAKNA